MARALRPERAAAGVGVPCQSRRFQARTTGAVVPELPEVETIRGQLEPRLVGRWIAGAESHPSEKFRPARDAAGAMVGGVSRRGKYLILALGGSAESAIREGDGASPAHPEVGAAHWGDRCGSVEQAAPGDPGGSADVAASGAGGSSRVRGGREMVVHLGMTGRLQFAAGEAPSDGYVRAWWRLDDGAVLELHDVRRFGRVRVVPAGCYDAIPTLAQLGPEPLGDGFSAAGLWAALRRSRRCVKTQLLSQRPVAGLGNIYADEALWRAGINPAKRRVTRAEAAALHTAIPAVLHQAIAHRGTTFRDYRTLLGPGGDNFAHLDCYGRRGEPCRRCGTELRSRVVDARTTTYCPACQR